MKRSLLLVSFLFLSACVDEATKLPIEDLPASEKEADAPAVRSSCSSEWRTVRDGIRYRSLRCNESNGELDLHVVEIDASRWKIAGRVVEPATASEVAKQSDALVAVNANFFDEDRRPLGTVVRDGEELRKPHPVSWQSIFYVTAEGEGGITVPSEWKSVASKASAAVQAGPRLVISGKKNRVAKGDPSLRSGVCVQEERILFFATPQDRFFDVHQMVDLAAKPEESGGLGCRDAMLFDGGPSAQMYVEGVVAIDGDDVPAWMTVEEKQKSESRKQK